MSVNTTPIDNLTKKFQRILNYHLILNIHLILFILNKI